MATKKSTKSKTTTGSNSFAGVKNLFTSKMLNILDKDKGTLGRLSENIPAYTSGLDALDYRNGLMEDGEKRLGFDGGKITYIIGNSGSGKSTITIQMACNIVDPYEFGTVFHFDTEKSTSRARVRNISGWSKEKFRDKYVHINQNVTSESFYATVAAIAQGKEEMREELEYETGELDEYGRKIKLLPPTVVILDSLAALVPNDVMEKDELTGQMTATSTARKNTAIFKGLVDILIRSNIMLIVINHINEKVEINPFAKTQAQVNFLGQNETLPGGRAPIFLSNTLIKLITSTKLDPEKDFRIKGFIVKAQLIKSRSNAAGNMVELVFDQNNGYNNALTNYHLLKTNKVLKGSGHGYWVESLPEVKFKTANFLEMYNENEELRNAIDSEAAEILEEFLVVTEDADTTSELDNEDIVEGNVPADLEYDEEQDAYYSHSENAWYVENEEGKLEKEN